MTTFLNRADIAKAVGNNPKIVQGFESAFTQIAKTQEATEANAGATSGLANATFVLLSSDDATPNQRILAVVAPLALDDGGPNGDITLSMSIVPLTKASPEIDTPTFPGLVNAANDAAAAAAGVVLNGAYRNGSVLMVRVV